MNYARKVYSFLTFWAMTHAALAEPQQLTDAQLDTIVAGHFNDLTLIIYAPVTVIASPTTDVGSVRVNVSLVLPFSFIDSAPSATAMGILSPNTRATALSNVLSHISMRVLQQ